LGNHGTLAFEGVEPVSFKGNDSSKVNALVASSPQTRPRRFSPFAISRTQPLRRWARYAAAMVTIFACFLVAWLMNRSHLNIANIIMIFVLGVAFVAARYGTGASVVASVLSAMTLAYYFLPPLMSLAVADVQHIIMLIVMSVVGILISSLTDQVRAQAAAARQHADHVEALYRMSVDLANRSGSDALAATAANHVQQTLGGDVTVFVDEPGDGVRKVASVPPSTENNSQDTLLARAIIESDTSDSAAATIAGAEEGVWAPLRSTMQTIGALRLRRSETAGPLSSDEEQLLNALAHQLAGVLERDRLSLKVQSVQIEAETERLRSGLLSSVTHDLRTPLAIITGAISSLIQSDQQLSADDRRDLCQTVLDYSNRMARLVDNLLNMTRIESGFMIVNKQLHVLEEVIGSALRLLAPVMGQRRVVVRLPDEFPLLPIDDVLFQQVLINLLENAQKYSPADSPIEIDAHVAGAAAVIEVSDRGPGLPEGQEQRVFEKFFRGHATGERQHGTGLGLAICRAIITAHRGTISAENRSGGGAIIRITLPLVITGER